MWGHRASRGGVAATRRASAPAAAPRGGTGGCHRRLPVVHSASSADPMAQLLAALALSGGLKDQGQRPAGGNSAATSETTASSGASDAALPPLSLLQSFFQDQSMASQEPSINTSSSGRQLLTWSEAVEAMAPGHPFQERARTVRGVAAAAAPFDAPRDAAISAGIIPPLVTLLVEAAAALGGGEQEGSEKSTTSSSDDAGSSAALVVEAACDAAEALGSLTGWPTVDDDARRSAAALGALPALSALLCHPPTAPAAAEALAGLVRCAPLANDALAAGALPPVVELLATAPDDATALIALEVLMRMAEAEAPRRAIAHDPTAIPALVRLLRGWAMAGISASLGAEEQEDTTDDNGMLEGGSIGLSADAERCILWASLLTDALVRDATLHNDLASSGLLPALLGVLGAAEADPEALRSAAGCLSDAVAAGPTLQAAITPALPTLVDRLPARGDAATIAEDAVATPPTGGAEALGAISAFDEEAAATAVWWLATEAPALHGELLSAGLVPRCAALISSEAATPDSPGSLSAFAVVVLLHLTEDSDAAVKARDAVVASGALPHLVSLLLGGGLDARGTRCVADLIAAVARGGGDAASRRRAAKAAGAVEALQAALLRAGGGADENLKGATKAALDALR